MTEIEWVRGNTIWLSFDQGNHPRHGHYFGPAEILTVGRLWVTAQAGNIEIRFKRTAFRHQHEIDGFERNLTVRATEAELARAREAQEMRKDISKFFERAFSTVNDLDDDETRAIHTAITSAKERSK